MSQQSPSRQGVPCATRTGCLIVVIGLPVLVVVLLVIGALSHAH